MLFSVLAYFPDQFGEFHHFGGGRVGLGEVLIRPEMVILLSLGVRLFFGGLKWQSTRFGALGH